MNFKKAASELKIGITDFSKMILQFAATIGKLSYVEFGSAKYMGKTLELDGSDVPDSEMKLERGNENKSNLEIQTFFIKNLSYQVIQKKLEGLKMLLRVA